MSSTAAHLELGRAGEALVAEWLERKGWRMVARNVRAGHKELDIVAMDGDELVIVEVRSRTVGIMQPPELSVGPRKIKRLISASKQYVGATGFRGNWRIDVAAVTIDRGGDAEIELFSDITFGMEADRL